MRADIGTRDHVKEGMKLFVGGGSKAYPVNLQVVSATEVECILRIESNDQGLAVEPGAVVSSHAYDFDAEGMRIDR